MIWRDRRGVAEEFTSLPALVAVVSGFAIYFSMLAGVYIHHNNSMNMIEMEEVAHYIACKITGGESPITDAPLVVNKIKWESVSIHDLKKFCNVSSYDYSVFIKVGGREYRKGEILKENRIIVSRLVAVKFSWNKTEYGKLYVAVWRKNG